MPQQLLKAFQAHPRIEHLRGEGVPQPVEAIALVLKIRFDQVFYKQGTRSCVAQGMFVLGIKEKLLVRLSYAHPCLKGLMGVLRENVVLIMVVAGIVALVAALLLLRLGGSRSEE